MAKIIESKTCPTCGHPHESGGLQRFEIPEIPVIDTRRLESLEKKVNSIQEAITSHPTPTESLLELWASCPECRSKAERLGILKPVESKEEEGFKVSW